MPHASLKSCRLLSFCRPGCSWAPGVRRFDVQQRDTGPLGTVYLDPRPRPNKVPGSVTFPIRCGRLASAGASGATASASSTAGYSGGGAASAAGATGHGGAPHATRGSASQGAAGSYQTPILALVGNFGGSTGGALRPSELRTLLHELGHCVHGLASRTAHQHLWGTRCAQDLAEVRFFYPYAELCRARFACWLAASSTLFWLYVMRLAVFCTKGSRPVVAALLGNRFNVRFYFYFGMFC